MICPFEIFISLKLLKSNNFSVNDNFTITYQFYNLKANVVKDASALSVKEKAVEQLRLVDSGIRSTSSKKYRLLYSDLKEEVLFLPGTEQDPFTPRKYVHLLGTHYSKKTIIKKTSISVTHLIEDRLSISMCRNTS